jgi:hypothetical protein
MKYSDAVEEMNAAYKLFNSKLITRKEYQDALNKIRESVGIGVARDFNLSDNGEIRDYVFVTLKIDRFEPDK